MQEKISKYLIIIFITTLFLPFSVLAQEKQIHDIGEYFSKKEKAIFEHALEYQDAFFNKIFPAVTVDFSEISISVVTDIKDDEMKHMQKKSSGYYSSFDRELVILKTEKLKHSFMETTFHELSHALLHLYSGSHFDQIHPWLNEGLAVYLARITYRSKKKIHKKNDYLIARVKTLIELHDLDIVGFVSWNHQKFTRESFSQEGYGYAVGYCMTLFLMNKDEKSAYSLFRSLIEDDMSTTEVFDKYYNGGFSQFEKDFIKFFSSIR